MKDFLTYRFVDSPEFINVFDETPLWSARFGFLLLDHIRLKSEMTVVDIGSGTGFPLIELAERLGSSSRIYGIDPWINANHKAKEKIKEYGITNIKIFEQSAEIIPLPGHTVDLVTSNLGINNFENKNRVLKECFRILKTRGKLAITTNPYGHWAEFYAVFESTLKQLNKTVYLEVLKEDQYHRGTINSVSELFIKNGFRVIQFIEDSFCMNFIDGTAFLNHHFVKCGWIETWFKLFPSEDRETIFKTLEENLNVLADKQNGLTLTVPMFYLEGEKCI